MLTESQSEKNTILELIEGDEQAFERLYKIYSPGLFGRLLKLVKSEAQAREILQEAFLIIWERRKLLNPDKSFRSFLYKIAENKVYDFFRKAARDKNLELQLIALSTPDYNIFEEFKSREENLIILQKAIESLPPQRQQVLKLCKLEGKSYKEVSELLGIKDSTISDHIVKGTKSIRDYFDKNNYTPSLLVLFLLTQS